MMAAVATVTPRWLRPETRPDIHTARHGPVTDSPRLLIAGSGRLGAALVKASAAAGDGYLISTLSRSATKLAGASHVVADLGRSADLLALGQNPFDALIYCPAPDQRSPAAYRQTYLYGLQNLLSCGALRANGRLIFVSSTAVYGQDDGSHVDELSATRPQACNGQILLQAEQHALSWPAASAGLRCCLRLAGLYEDLPRRYLQWLHQPLADPGALLRWSNRIHLQDAARLILLLLAQSRMPTHINGVDNEPSRLLEVLQWLAAQRGLTPPEPPPDASPRTGQGDGQRGKRVSNALAHSLGFVPVYPSFREGFAESANTAAMES